MSLKDRLKTTQKPVAAKVQKQQQAQDNNDNNGDDNVVDADFEDVK